IRPIRPHHSAVNPEGPKGAPKIFPNARANIRDSCSCVPLTSKAISSQYTQSGNGPSFVNTPSPTNQNSRTSSPHFNFSPTTYRSTGSRAENIVVNDDSSYPYPMAAT